MWIRIAVVMIAVTVFAGPAQGESQDKSLAAAALRLEDLPDGWSEDDVSLSSSDGGKFCPASTTTNHIGRFDTQFSGGSSGPLAVSTTRRYKKGQGKPTFARYVKTMKACGPEKVEKNGKTETTQLFVMKVPKLGDEAFGFRLKLSGGDFDVSAEAVAVRKGDIVMVVSVGGLIVQPQAHELATKIAPRLAKVK